MDERKILSRYEVLIFDDGSMESKRLPIDVPETKMEKFIDLNMTSNRIGQILLTLKYLTKQFDEFDYEAEDMFLISSEFREAVRKASNDYGVDEKSVLDKFIRQTKRADKTTLKMEYLKDILMDYLQNMDNNPKRIMIKEILIESISDNTTKRDLVAINDFFEQPSIRFVLKSGKTV